MRRISLILLILSATLVMAARPRATEPPPADTVIALERAALDRWGRGDPAGFLETYAREITYFDIGTEHRFDGLETMANYYRQFTGRINIPRYEMINPRVQRRGDVAILTYNLRSEGVQPDGGQVTVRWNSTSVYARFGRDWRMIHSHWSLTAPACLRGIV